MYYLSEKDINVLCSIKEKYNTNKTITEMKYDIKELYEDIKASVENICKYNSMNKPIDYVDILTTRGWKKEDAILAIKDLIQTNFELDIITGKIL
jgi:hypothetical protein